MGIFKGAFMNDTRLLETRGVYTRGDQLHIIRETPAKPSLSLRKKTQHVVARFFLALLWASFCGAAAATVGGLLAGEGINWASSDLDLLPSNPEVPFVTVKFYLCLVGGIIATIIVMRSTLYCCEYDLSKKEFLRKIT